MTLIPVTELKQWAYCPRVVFYHRTMPTAGRMTAEDGGGSPGTRPHRAPGECAAA